MIPIHHRLCGVLFFDLHIFLGRQQGSSGIGSTFIRFALDDITTKVIETRRESMIQIIEAEAHNTDSTDNT